VQAAHAFDKRPDFADAVTGFHVCEDERAFAALASTKAITGPDQRISGRRIVIPVVLKYT